MTTMLPLPTEIVALEEQLKFQKDDMQRLAVIDKLTAYYAYTDVSRALELLAIQKRILLDHDFPDLRLTYHLRMGFIKNQLYDFHVADLHYSDALELIEERGDTHQRISAYADYGGLCINNKKYSKAEDYLERAKKLLNHLDSDSERLQATVLCNRGYLHLHYGEIEYAIKHFLDALNITKDLAEDDFPFYHLQSLIFNGLGSVYSRVQDYAEAIRAHLQGANICETMGMRTRLSWFYHAVGNGHLSLGDDDAAEQYFQKAIEIEGDVSTLSRAGSYASLGTIYAERDQMQRSLELYDRAEKLYLDTKVSSDSNLANIERQRGNLYRRAGKYTKALATYRRAYELALNVEDYRLLTEVYDNMAACYSEKGDHKEAYEYQLIRDGLAKKAAEDINKEKINELVLRYDAERARREREIMRLQTVELQAKALRAQMNPHFLFNALNSIQNFISESEVEGADSAVRFLASFSNLMRKSLEYSEKQNISLEDELVFLKEYLEINAKLRFEDRLSYQIEVDEEIEDDIIGVPTMIIQPYVENAIEHGLRNKKDGKVTINFYYQDEDVIRCVVQDNGIGRKKRRTQQLEDPRFQNHRSRGTAITEERLCIAHGVKEGMFVKTTDVERNGKVEGTKVEILIPIMDL